MSLPRELLQQVLDTSSVAIFVVDKTGRITQANQRMAEMFGCTLADLTGAEYVSLVHPDERETGRERMLALLADRPMLLLGTHFAGPVAGRVVRDGAAYGFAVDG